MSNRRTVAMVVNDDAGHLVARGALRFIASMLAPTEGMRMASDQAGRSGASLLIVIWLLMFLPPHALSLSVNL
ncbi:hypothetical protein [Pseudomonas sp. PSB11]|uniref:hypothetical protein n=1 Tax=Pseudomonas sp. PSB11 TaxID=2021969 RepID=UPI0016614FA2|nr:hypothetical protein [Pseudomonas sp. PSB11]MBD0682729.1 hypothetical protein [Pseudomonas sp. PSB11]